MRLSMLTKRFLSLLYEVACVVVFVWDSFGRVVEEEEGSIVVAMDWCSSLPIDHIATTAL
jgi:hypothetical protein